MRVMPIQDKKTYSSISPILYSVIIIVHISRILELRCMRLKVLSQVIKPDRPRGPSLVQNCEESFISRLHQCCPTLVVFLFLFL